jgi:hypothetical protein
VIVRGAAPHQGNDIVGGEPDGRTEIRDGGFVLLPLRVGDPPVAKGQGIVRIATEELTAGADRNVRVRVSLRAVLLRTSLRSGGGERQGRAGSPKLDEMANAASMPPKCLHQGDGDRPVPGGSSVELATSPARLSQFGLHALDQFGR